VYFWDDRDGPEISGWWFAPEVGSDQVWAFNRHPSATPPGLGWRIPFDGPVDPTMHVRTESVPEVEDFVSSAKRPRLPDDHAAAMEEQKRKDAEAAARLRKAQEDAARQKRLEEDGAALAVRRAMQKLSTSSSQAEYDELNAILAQTQAEQWPCLGEKLQEQVASEITEARSQAQKRVRRLEEQNAESEKVKLEKALLQQQEERRLQEEWERLEAVFKTAKEQVSQADLEADSAETAAHALTASRKQDTDKLVSCDGVAMDLLPPPATALRAARTADELRIAAFSGLNAVISDLRRTMAALEDQLAQLPSDSGSVTNYTEARSKLANLVAKVEARRSIIDAFSQPLAEALQIAQRRVAAQKWEAEQEAIFKCYDNDCDERLSAEEIVALARGLYNFEVTEVFVNRAMRLLAAGRGSGVPYGSFRRLRQMLGVELCEVRKRERLLAEIERRKQEAYEAAKARQAVADRKLNAQSLLDDASEFLSDIAAELPKVEEAGRPILAEERLNAAALRGATESTEHAFKALDAAIEGARVKFDEVSKLLNLDEELDRLLRPELLRIQARLDREEQERVAPLRAALADARERAAKKESEEEKSTQRKKALSKLEQAYEQLEDDGTDEEFDF
jgi:hypothetical protein